jgi:indoleacetamide hydrolase
VNGLAGFRPTWNRYSGKGITPMINIRDTIGPLAHNVDDLILLDDCLSGHKFDAENELKSLKGLRFGVSPLFCDSLDPHVAIAFERAIKCAKEAGADIVNVDLEPIRDLNEICTKTLILVDIKFNLTNYLRHYSIDLTLNELVDGVASLDVKKLMNELLESKQTIEESEYVKKRVRNDLINVYQKAFADHNLDALMFPTLSRLPIRIDDPNLNESSTFNDFVKNLDADSNAGIPSITINMGRTEDIGLPMGLNFDALHNEDHKILAIAKLMESELSKLLVKQ